MYFEPILGKGYVLAKEKGMLNTFRNYIHTITGLGIDSIKFWESIYAGELWKLEHGYPNDLCIGEVKQELLKLIGDLIFDLCDIILPDAEQADMFNTLEKQYKTPTKGEQTTC